MSVFNSNNFSGKKYITFSIAIFLALNLPLIFFNILINPYKIFSTPESEINRITNNYLSDRVAKFYSAKRINPSVLMMGNSRMGALDPKSLEKYTDGRVYNLSFGGSHIAEQYYYLKYFIEHYNIDTIVHGLDFYSFMQKIEDYDDLASSNFDINRFNYFYLKDYLNGTIGYKALLDSWNTLIDNKESPSSLEENTINFHNGEITYYKNYREIKRKGVAGFKKIAEKRIGNKIANYKRNNFNKSSALLSSDLDSNIGYIKKLVELCNQNDIDLILYFSATHAKHADLIYSQGFGELLEYWKTNIVNIADVYDFSGRNSITDDAENYLDATHLKKKVGKLIFAKIFNDNYVDVPEDFGILLNKDNINLHFLNYRNKINFDL